MDSISIDGHHLTIDMLERVASGQVTVSLEPSARARVAAARDALVRLLERGDTVYGANTGFGLMSDVRIPDDQIDRLQVNLIRSHCAGVGEPLPLPVTRVMMLLRANVLASGHSAVRVELIDALLEMLNADVVPVIPSRGSVGASGDLTPLAHLAIVLMGEGEAFHEGARLPAPDALSKAGLRPFRLGAREGLALVNGTQAMTAIGTLSLLEAERLMTQADVAGAMTLEGLLGSSRPFDDRLAALRSHPGHVACASNMRTLLVGSELMASHKACGRVQDSYSLRCIPQVHGASRDALSFVRRCLEIEINAVTDNPIFYPETGEAVPGGNFHGAPVAQAMDLLCIALTDAGSISERRTERLTNPALSGLPAFLARSPGLESGLMMAQVTAAALTSENKTLSHPASVDSIPTGAGKEDHVSMGVTAALKAARVVEHLESILAIELMAAAAAIEMRRPLRSSPALEAVHERIRSEVAPLDTDRALDSDISAIAGMLREGAIRRAAESVTGSLQMNPGDGTRGTTRPAIRAPRGTTLSCKGWPQEAALRMLMNNLDPEVAEKPDELIVYGGSGKAARNWECYEAIVRCLRTLDHDETLLVQSGKPVGVFKTHADAPRVLISNAMLVPAWGTWDHFRELERQGLMMFGQMTAGSWIYIGTQGILQGTYETFAAAARRHFGGSLKGRLLLTAGLGGMGGAQPLAGTMNEAIVIAVEVDPERIRRRLETKYCDVMETDLDGALKRAESHKASGEPISIALLGNAADVFRAIASRGITPDLVTDQTSAHDNLNGYVPNGMSYEEALALRSSDPARYMKESMRTMAEQVRAMLDLKKAGAVVFDYGNNIRGQAREAGVADAFDFPGFVPAYVRPLFCEGKGPFRWAALSGDPADIHRTDEAILEAFPDDEPLCRWIRMARDRVSFQGLPSRICWLGYGERARFGLIINDLVASGAIKAPIVIGRDHLDSGSVASPNRETEGMRDGSDAVADWPILNALVNTAAGATWVSVHHGGGVGIGLSIHAGMVVVADGTPEAARRLERVLTTDPGTGIMRHVDAGYPEAVEAAHERGVSIPMSPGPPRSVT